MSCVVVWPAVEARRCQIVPVVVAMLLAVCPGIGRNRDLGCQRHQQNQRNLGLLTDHHRQNLALISRTRLGISSRLEDIAESGETLVDRVIGTVMHQREQTKFLCVCVFDNTGHFGGRVLRIFIAWVGLPGCKYFLGSRLCD